MDNFYNQQYSKAGFESAQPHIKRKMSTADYNTFNDAMYANSMMHENMAEAGKSGVNLGMGVQSPMSTGNMAQNMAQNNMLKFNGGTGGSPEANLDEFQFSPSANMMMQAGAIFRSPAAANNAAAMLANQQSNQAMNTGNQYVGQASSYGSMAPPGSNFGQSSGQNARMNMAMASQYMSPNMPQNMGQHMSNNIGMSMDFNDPAMTSAFDNSNNFNMMLSDQSMQSMMNNSSQPNFIPSLSRDSTRSSQDQGSPDAPHPGYTRTNSGSSNLRHQSNGDPPNINDFSRNASISSHDPTKHSQIQSNPAYPPNMQTRQQQEQPPPLQQNHDMQRQRHQSQDQLQSGLPSRQNSVQQQGNNVRRQNSTNTDQQSRQNSMHHQGDQRRQQHQHQNQSSQSQQQLQQYEQQQNQHFQQTQNQQQDYHRQQQMQQQHQYQQQQSDQFQQNQRPSYSQSRSNDSQSQQWNQSSQQKTFTQDMPMRQPPRNGQYMNAYSSTGFDMMTVLMKVATRKNAEVNIGAVDLSCAFVVCDALAHDFPILYCSENFERLTGYTKHEILGRNCRFLQAPNGKVQAGIKRGYVDDDSVLYLKNMITLRREAQVSIINYRKGGQPFMNLLTMIPIGYDSDDIKFFVGFQVDLVEQPNSVTNKNPDGTYTVNYQRGLSMPRYVFSGNERNRTRNSLEGGQTIPRDDVSTVLGTIGSGESEISRRIFDKVLLENTDDVIFVLSLKGLFLYLSPSCAKILEYDSAELSGTALSSICHPSDIVPVTRELRDTAAAATVNIVFRIRRKNNGYMWFEGSGSLHTEQGKGRKSIVMVGRERPVYTLSKVDIIASGGINDNEVWTKLSTAGMFLFVSGTVKQLLDKQPEELVGTSIQALMRPDSRQDFMRILEVARTGKRASCKHDLMNRRGQVLQAFTTIYPGDAVEGLKPTFIVAQTRLLKYSRSAPTSTIRQIQPPLERIASNGAPNSETPSSVGTPRNSFARSQSQTMSLNTPQRYMSTFETATTTAGQHGLELGHQDFALASDENLFEELKTTRSTSWQFELRQMEKRNRLLAEELQGLLAARKKRKRRKGTGNVEKDCANCHTRVTPEWRRGPSGNRDLCNSCGLRWAKQQGRISPRTTGHARSVHSGKSDKSVSSPPHRKSSGQSNGDDSRTPTGIMDDVLQETGESMNQGSGMEREHVTKSAKMEDDAEGVSHTFFGEGSSLPTKIEEGVEDDGDGDEEMS